VGDDVYTSIHTDIGQGHSAYALYELLGYETISRWLPFVSTADEVVTYCRNKALRPATIPMTLRDLFLEHALLRAGIAQMVAASRPSWFKQANLPPMSDLPEFNPIIGAGASLAQTGSGGVTAMLLLDSLQPAGVTDLFTDPAGLMPAMGALAYFKPEAVVQVMERGSLESIGTAFSLDGMPRAERPAMHVTIRTEDETIEQRIDGGHLWLYPLSIGQEAEVSVRVMARGATINGKRRLKQKVLGGSAGLIFDTRGRPLPLAERVADRAAQMLQWHAEAAGTALMAVPPDWLEAVASEDSPAPAAPSRRSRRQLRALDEDKVVDEQETQETELAVDDILDALS
jgi:hypothetical protein